MNHEGMVATTSHDQRLRVWAVHDDGSSELSIESFAGSFAESPEPEALDACSIFHDKNVLRVVVAGRGIQIHDLILSGQS